MGDTATEDRADRLVVYTAVFGAGYELPPRPSGRADAVCFTDRADLEPNGWTVHVVRPLLPADLARSSREQKIRPYRWLPDHARSLYIDPSVELLTDPEELWKELAGDDPHFWFGAFQHSFRVSVAGEIDAVLDNRFEAPERVHEHVRALVLTEGASLRRRPVWAGVLARRHHDPRCAPAMEDWHAQVLRYSRRDQISLPGVLDRAGADGVRLVDGDNRATAWHRWPRSDYQRPETYLTGVTEALVPDILRAERAAAQAQALALEVEELRAETVRLRAELMGADAVAAERDAAVRQRDQMLGSRSWRWTQWPRQVARGPRRG
jgi:hypothetical protein